MLQEIAAANSREGLLETIQAKHARIRRNPILPAFAVKEDHSIKQLSGQHALPVLNNPENEAPTSSFTHTAIPATLTVIGSVGLLTAGVVATYFFKSSFGRAKSDAQNDPLHTQETSSLTDMYISKV